MEDFEEIPDDVMDKLSVEIDEHEEKRWRQADETSNKRGCGNSRATYFRNNKNDRDGHQKNLKAAENTVPLSSFFKLEGNLLRSICACIYNIINKILNLL